tara:strand:+ start:1636 stop:2223 length:588 start_codon:yes stop_codon:yes gene_type:complete
MARIQHRREARPEELRTVEGGQKLKYPVNLVAEAIRREGLEAGLGPNVFLVRSGYRSVAHQERLWRRAVERHGSEAAARRFVAPPGNSAHQTGGAMDLDLGLPTCCDSRRVAEYANTRAFRFLQEIAPRYKLTNYEAEPWQWECDEACEQNILEMNRSEGGVSSTGVKKAAKYAGIGLGAIALGVGAFYLAGGFD